MPFVDLNNLHQRAAGLVQNLSEIERPLRDILGPNGNQLNDDMRTREHQAIEAFSTLTRAVRGDPDFNSHAAILVRETDQAFEEATKADMRAIEFLSSVTRDMGKRIGDARRDVDQLKQDYIDTANGYGEKAKNLSDEINNIRSQPPSGLDVIGGIFGGGVGPGEQQRAQKMIELSQQRDQMAQMAQETQRQGQILNELYGRINMLQAQIESSMGGGHMGDIDSHAKIMSTASREFHSFTAQLSPTSAINKKEVIDMITRVGTEVTSVPNGSPQLREMILSIADSVKNVSPQ